MEVLTEKLEKLGFYLKINFSDESGRKYRFLVALDVKGLYNKSKLKIKRFNRFTKRVDC